MSLRRALIFTALLPVACSSSSQQTRKPSPLETNQDLSSYHRSLSYSLLRTGQHMQALPHIRRMLKSEESAAEGHYLMARVNMNMHRYR